MTALYEFRPFNPTDEEYERVNTVHNLTYPDDPKDVEMAKHYDAERNPAYLYTQHVCLHDGEIVGTCAGIRTFWLTSPDQFRLWWVILREHEEAATVAMLNHLQTMFASHNPQSYLSPAREGEAIRCAVLEADGFTLIQRDLRSALDVPAFSSAAYTALLDKIDASEINIIDHTELMARNPNWLADLWDMRWEVEREMPSSETFEVEQPPVDHFAKRFDAPNFDPRAYLYALDGDEIVGMSNVYVNPHATYKLKTGFTGVTRPYRRKGIATALKVRIIQFAQAYGAKIIETDNEESNPMYTLNVQLGFRPIPANLEYKKQL